MSIWVFKKGNSRPGSGIAPPYCGPNNQRRRTGMSDPHRQWRPTAYVRSTKQQKDQRRRTRMSDPHRQWRPQDVRSKQQKDQRRRTRMSDPHGQWRPTGYVRSTKQQKGSKASDKNVRPTQTVATHRVCEVHKATERSKASDKNVRPTRALATPGCEVDKAT